MNLPKNDGAAGRLVKAKLTGRDETRSYVRTIKKDNDEKVNFSSYEICSCGGTTTDRNLPVCTCARNKEKPGKKTLILNDKLFCVYARQRKTSDG